MAIVYKIHPAIGIGRVGNSTGYYIAPTQAGGLPTEYSNTPLGGNLFRDANNDLLRQAAKFQVYAYDDSNPNDPGTVVVPGQGGVSISWQVWIANKKASWFQFEQHTGSGMGPYDSGNSGAPGTYAFTNDQGYLVNNTQNPWIPGTPNGNPTDKNKPANPIRYSNYLGTSDAPNTMGNANRQQLILDPGPRSLSGPNQEADFTLDSGSYPFLTRMKPFQISTLGSMLTDAEGNLIVVPGFGNSGTVDYQDASCPQCVSKIPLITDYANNSGWFDDIADGPVEATLTINGTPFPVESAWFSAAPPKYAPEAVNMITMYDNMYDIFIRQMGANSAIYHSGAFQASYRPNFFTEVLPILSRPDIYKYLANMPTVGVTNHVELLTDTSSSFAQTALAYVRGRGTQNGLPGPAENLSQLMPYLAGDNPISNFTISKFLGLTQTQFFFLSQFAKGIVDNSPPAKTLGPGTLLDRATLENCVGGPFTPGIEATWITRNTSIYRPISSQAPSQFFRINGSPISSLKQGTLSLTNGNDNNYATRGMEPGDLTKYMAQPWQADFNECSIQPINTRAGSLNSPLTASQTLWWWPVQRPYSIYPVDSPEVQVGWTRGFKGAVDDTPTDLQMVTNWKDMGFIKQQSNPGANPAFQEIERNTNNINNYQPPT